MIMEIGIGLIILGINALLLHKQIVYRERDRFVNSNDPKQYIVVYTRDILTTHYKVNQTVTNKNPQIYKTNNSLNVAKFANDCMRKSSMAHPMKDVLEKIEQTLSEIERRIEEQNKR